jgi:hypothetical protein
MYRSQAELAKPFGQIKGLNYRISGRRHEAAIARIRRFSRQFSGQ